MIPEIPQVLLWFTPGPRPGEPARLRVARTVRECFERPSDPGEEYSVSLPRAIEATALMDAVGWRRRERQGLQALDLGRQLWERLPAAVRGLLRRGVPGRSQRIAVVSTSTGTDDVPWEWMNEDPAAPLAARDDVRFVRLVPLLYAPPPLTVAYPVRVLVVVPNPKDERLLDVNAEIDVVTRGLRGLRQYAVEILTEPRAEALREAFTRAPDVVHYVGHAGLSGATGNLIVLDDRGVTQWVTPQQVATSLPASVRLLCLSTCVTVPNYEVGGLVRFAQAPPEVSLPTIVANQYALAREPAALFWGAFYAGLLEHGGDAVEAIHGARMAVRSAVTLVGDPLAWASFLLVIRDGVGQPFRLGAAERQASPERYAAEIQAQWSSRLANSLADRLRSLGPDGQVRLKSLMRAEVESAEAHSRDLEKE